MLVEYQSATEGFEILEHKIEQKLTGIYNYFEKISYKNNDLSKRRNDSSDKDSTEDIYRENFYSDGESDDDSEGENNEWSDLGVHTNYVDNITFMEKILKRRYKSLEEKLTALHDKIENYVMINKMIAINISFKDDPENEGLLFWYKPSEKLLKYLPKDARAQIKREFELLESGAICGAPIDGENAYMDIWKSCSGDVQNLRIFPNPVSEALKVKFELATPRKISIAVCNLKGQKVLTLKDREDLTTGTHFTTFDVSSLKPNIYFIVVTSEKGEKASLKFIKE